MRTNRLLCAALASVVLVSVPLATRADEGMWVYSNIPRDAIRKRYGITLTDAWLDRVRMSSVRFNSGGSGSFVSRDGLVLTNHHVASDTLSKISTPERNYYETGFLARTRAEEVRAVDLELNVLEGTEDVTGRIGSAITPDMDAATAAAARRAAIAEIEKASLAATGLRSDVVTLYRGAQYHLYRYRKYTDVRLVFAPEFDVAFFGGDPDNFEYPRYNLDMAIFRVYEDGKPVTLQHWLPWSRTGVSEGDPIFVSGNPGSTARLNTVGHLEFLRDVQYPFDIRRLERSLAVLAGYSTRGPEQERQAHDDLFGVSNSLKVRRGENRALTDPVFQERKRAAEMALRKRIAADPKLAGQYDGAWQAIDRARTSFRGVYVRYRLLEAAAAFGSTYFNVARTLVRLADENERPNPQRLREYSEAGRASLELQLYSPAPVYPDLERSMLASTLAFARDELGSDDPAVKAILEGRSPEERAGELVAGTTLGDVAVRKQIAAGGRAAIEASTDAMIHLARAVDAESRALRKQYEDGVTAVEEPSYGKIARALYALDGPRQYPDATFTLRLAFGAVRGYEQDGKRIAPFTTFEGMFERADRLKNAAPNRLPGSWIGARSRLSMRTPLNFVTTSDTIGGNSGSPLVNAKGELVGLNFDRNVHGLVRNFLYDETRARNVAVDARGMLEALRSIYGARELVAELTGAPAR